MIQLKKVIDFNPSLKQQDHDLYDDIQQKNLKVYYPHIPINSKNSQQPTIYLISKSQSTNSYDSLYICICMYTCMYYRILVLQNFSRQNLTKNVSKQTSVKIQYSRFVKLQQTKYNQKSFEIDLCQNSNSNTHIVHTYNIYFTITYLLQIPTNTTLFHQHLENSKSNQQFQIQLLLESNRCTPSFKYQNMILNQVWCSQFNNLVQVQQCHSYTKHLSYQNTKIQHCQTKPIKQARIGPDKKTTILTFKHSQQKYLYVS
eukprot:TRINITY_DN2726_c0_g1_i5.p1 TRINITY_DN2726_c0_g1~~TRINITY_DN2726_c0_g1_i5.p1  ORF type:complete len:290 (+),score=-17.93 TRINITY_DN2726_c0_g1_i5:99-872(+)